MIVAELQMRACQTAGAFGDHRRAFMKLGSFTGAPVCQVWRGLYCSSYTIEQKYISNILIFPYTLNLDSVHTHFIIDNVQLYANSLYRGSNSSNFSFYNLVIYLNSALSLLIAPNTILYTIIKSYLKP